MFFFSYTGRENLIKSIRVLHFYFVQYGCTEISFLLLRKPLMSETVEQMLARAKVNENDGMDCLYGTNIGNFLCHVIDILMSFKKTRIVI